MKRYALLALLMAAVVYAFAGVAMAQTDDTETEETTTEATSGGGAGTGINFVDEDGDGINDNSMARHRAQAMKQRGERVLAANRARLLETLTAQLTEEQQTELQTLLTTLREEGKTPTEIHTAVGAKLVEYGVTLPEEWNQTPQQAMQQNRLSTQQREEVRALVQSMQADGKTREEIRAAVAAKYEEWGKEMPGLRYGARNRQRAQQQTSE